MAAVVMKEALAPRAGSRRRRDRRRHPRLRHAGRPNRDSTSPASRACARGFRSRPSAVTVNRFCSSVLQAIAYGAERIMTGAAHAILAAEPNR
jgi:3-oxoacyl-(acyl-carrier-protein) synthase